MTRQIFSSILGSKVKGHKFVNVLTGFHSDRQIMYQLLMCAKMPKKSAYNIFGGNLKHVNGALMNFTQRSTGAVH